jgi:flagellar hook-basal body complex protein FliE
MAIAPVNPIAGISIPEAARIGGSAKAGAGAFQDVLRSAIQTVEASSQAANASVERFLSGEGEELHTTILATQKAELTFEMFLQVRNKVVSAYQEIMRMQI